ncbi:MAG: arginase family protein [Chthoniobacterales bacterium]
MSTSIGTTMRLNMPQWQGGNEHGYYFGAQLPAWLAPAGKGPVETVPVPEPKPGETLIIENGIVGRAAVVQQARLARQVIEKHHPDRIVTLGGDCLVDLAPIAYLNTRYGGNLGVLWVDAHPDVMTPKDFAHAHAQVLGALLGRGDTDLTGEVRTPVASSRVMYAGLDAWLPVEADVINELGLRRAGADALRDSSSPVLEWISDQGISQLAIHFDLDVLDPTSFRAVVFNKPGSRPDFLAGVPRGADEAGTGCETSAGRCARLRCSRACNHRAHAVGHARNA